MMRSIAVGIGAVMMVGGLWSVLIVHQGLAVEPAAPSSSSEMPGAAAGKEASKPEAISPMLEGEPPAPSEAGEVQERAVIRDHRTKQGVFMPLQTAPPPLGQPAPQLLLPGVTPNPPAFGSLPGDFSIRPYLKNTPFTARDGGHHSIDAVITVDTVIGPNQRFKLATVQPDFTTIQTSGGYYMSAVGGLGGLPNTTQGVQTELTTPQRDIALFRIDGPTGQGTFTMKTYDGHFLTALGGGGKATDAFHTDATKANTWEYFWILKCGDLGSGYTYAIRPTGTGYSTVSFLTANGGGGQTTQAMTAFSGLGGSSQFKLIRQGDGSYALQTSNRVTDQFTK